MAVFFWATFFSFLKILFLDFHIFIMGIIFSQVESKEIEWWEKKKQYLTRILKRTVFFFLYCTFLLYPCIYKCFYNILVATTAPSELFKILQGKINFFELIFFKSYDLVISYCSFFNLTFTADVPSANSPKNKWNRLRNTLLILSDVKKVRS